MAARSPLALIISLSPPLAPPHPSPRQAAIAELSGDLDIYVSSFRPMKNTLSGRDEKTLMKLVVHAESGRVVGVHMVRVRGGENPKPSSPCNFN